MSDWNEKSGCVERRDTCSVRERDHFFLPIFEKDDVFD